MAQLYPHLTEEMAKRVRAILEENLSSIAQEDLWESMKADFLSKEQEGQLMSASCFQACCNQCKPCPVKYAVYQQADLYPPELSADQTELILSTIDSIRILSQEAVLVDLGVHLQIPVGYLLPVHPEIYTILFYHTGITNEDLRFSLKIFVKKTGKFLFYSPLAFRS